MSDRFQPLSISQVAPWVFGELDKRGSVFGIPQELFFRPAAGDAFRTAMYGQALETPFGVAAGPHSQMAQNIVAAWLQGSRFIELKTVQTLDELEVSKPCIDMQDEGYNVEWSQELKIDQSFNEYLMAWVLIHALHHKLGFAGAPGMIFNMSVGYNLEGILKPNVQGFLARMDDAGPALEATIAAVAKVYPAVKDLKIPSRLSDNVTLSTMHGCPPEEIGKIAAYLIEERGLQTNVKLNPTLLGPDMLRGILNKVCGFKQVTVPDEAFGHDLKYPDALKILNDLRARAAKKGVAFGVKLSNTLEVINHRKVFAAKEKMMYLSGRPLQAITVNLAAKLAAEFKGDLKMSYAGGADSWNVAELLACGMTTITSSSDLLRPGGYARTLQYISETTAAMKAAGAKDLPAFILAKAGAKGGDVKAAALANLTKYAEAVLKNPLYHRDSVERQESKSSRPLGFFDCVKAPCTDTCPIDQDVPGYMDAVKRGALDEAAAIVRRDNVMGATLGRACNHACELTCVRTHFDQPLAIREIKRFIMENGRDPALQAGAPRKGKVAIIGAGPCGLSAAGFLREGGIDVTVFDARMQAGGMTTTTLPQYRSLPQVVQKDVARLETAGVKFEFGQVAGRDFTIESLRGAGHDFIVVAAGAQKGMPLGVEGQESQGVLDGMEFLRMARDGELKLLKGRVGVVGGGDVAMDCARVAKRLGGEVTVIYRRTTEEMPAHHEEVVGLLKEGIPIKELSAPKAVVAANGKLTGLRCSTMKLGEPDASGRRRPVEVPGADFTVELDYLIAAIGQQPALEFIDGKGIEKNRKGYIVADAVGATSAKDIFAGGDAVNDGPLTLVKAQGDGKRIAGEILRRLAGIVAPSEPMRCTGGLDLPAEIRKRATRVARVGIPELPAYGRMGFDEVVLTLKKDDAKAEAERCLRCDRFCSICTSVCPNHAFLTYSSQAFSAELATWTVEGGKAVPGKPEKFAVAQAYQTAVLTDFCNECGNCATFCPTAGRPYADKPRLYVSKSEFEAQADNAFRITGSGASRAIAGRFAGATHTLAPKGAGFEYRAPGLSVELNAKLQPKGAPAVSAPEGASVGLVPAAIMAALLRGIAPEQLPVVAE
ncbi:MAG TPA: putative selenate reductase subunit YgfK [Verrucomicrobia bacterium]|nr:putative selenate reductase subunit YgfK [Verrucomicrobiota bacterium]